MLVTYLSDDSFSLLWDLDSAEESQQIFFNNLLDEMAEQNLVYNFNDEQQTPEMGFHGRVNLAQLPNVNVKSVYYPFPVYH